MIKANRSYRLSAGFFCGFLVCLLVFFGCGGKNKANPSEHQKQKQDVVRKIPAAEPKAVSAVAKQQKETAALPQNEPAGAAVPTKAATHPETQQPQPAISVPTAGGQMPASASQPAASPVQGEPSAEATAEAVVSKEKQAEMDAVTKEAGTLHGEMNKKVAESTNPAGKPAASVKQEAAPSEEGQGTDTETPPVIDLGKGGAGAGTEENIAGNEKENDNLVVEEGPKSELFNPFAPLYQKEKTGVSFTGDLRQQRKFITELEKIDIGQLTLDGVILAQSGNRAILTDASGKGYVVKEGTYVGLNSGTVETIESDRIVINETNGTRQSKTVLKLQKPAGEE